jgi:hypothetical protein
MIRRILDAAALLVGWCVLGLLLLGVWALSVGQYRLPVGVERDLPGEPEGAFAAAGVCVMVGVEEAARRLARRDGQLGGRMRYEDGGSG